jgi:hypothetical protein
MNKNDLLSIPIIPEKLSIPSDLEEDEIYEWVMYSMECFGFILRAYTHHQVKTRDLIVYAEETKATIVNAMRCIGHISRRDTRFHKINAKIEELSVYTDMLRSLRYVDANGN